MARLKQIYSDAGNWLIKHRLLIISLVPLCIGALVLYHIATDGQKPPSAQSDKNAVHATRSPSPSKSVASHSPGFKTETAALPHVVVELNGPGTKFGQRFTVKEKWDLEWTYNCSDSRVPSGLSVVTYDSPGHAAASIAPITHTAPNGSGLQHYSDGGSYTLSVNSYCSWHLTISE